MSLTFSAPSTNNSFASLATSFVVSQALSVFPGVVIELNLASLEVSFLGDLSLVLLSVSFFAWSIKSSFVIL